MEEIRIDQVNGYYSAYIAGSFLCTADSFTEALNEARAYLRERGILYAAEN